MGQSASAAILTGSFGGESGIGFHNSITGTATYYAEVGGAGGVILQQGSGSYDSGVYRYRDQVEGGQG